jgi:hypothetical protein
MLQRLLLLATPAPHPQQLHLKVGSVPSSRWQAIPVPVPHHQQQQAAA